MTGKTLTKCFSCVLMQSAGQMRRLPQQQMMHERQKIDDKSRHVDEHDVSVERQEEENASKSSDEEALQAVENTLLVSSAAFDQSSPTIAEPSEGTNQSDDSLGRPNETNNSEQDTHNDTKHDESESGTDEHDMEEHDADTSPGNNTQPVEDEPVDQNGDQNPTNTATVELPMIGGHNKSTHSMQPNLTPQSIHNCTGNASNNEGEPTNGTDSGCTDNDSVVSELRPPTPMPTPTAFANRHHFDFNHKDKDGAKGPPYDIHHQDSSSGQVGVDVASKPPSKYPSVSTTESDPTRDGALHGTMAGFLLLGFLAMLAIFRQRQTRLRERGTMLRQAEDEYDGELTLEMGTMPPDKENPDSYGEFI